MPSDIVAGTESSGRKKMGEHGNTSRGGPSSHDYVHTAGKKAQDGA